MTIARTARRTRRAWLPLVAAALLFAQMLGLMHRVAHAPAVHQSVVAAGLHHAADPLFGDHDDASTCQLYDQLAHGDLAFDSHAGSALGAPRGVDSLRRPAAHIAAQAAGFLARGPPALG